MPRSAAWHRMPFRRQDTGKMNTHVSHHFSSTNKLYRRNILSLKDTTMSTRFRINLVIAGFLLAICIIGIVTAANLAHTWQEQPAFDGSFSGLMFSSDGSMVFAGGSQLLVRSWDGDIHWGGRSGTVAAMNSEGTRVISALDSSVRVFDKNGEEVWTRILGSSPIRAVAVSKDGSLILGANDEGYIQAWDINGTKGGFNKTDLVKKIAISPSQALIVATTEAGLKFFSPKMEQIWADDKEGTLDSFIAFSADSGTVITSGDKRVWSHTGTGKLNWMKEVTQTAITDMVCSDDLTTIVLGRKDGDVLVLDEKGQERWKYRADSWIMGVGVSSDGSIIAAGALDGTLYILDRNGNLLVKTTTDTLIQQGSVMVSRDGKHIIVADEGTLYGLDLLGLPEVTSPETRTPTPEVPATCPTCPACPGQVTTSSSARTMTVPPTTGTPATPLNPYLVFIASAGGALIVLKRQT
jgi:outer membrane protein assembly factor BamB